MKRSRLLKRRRLFYVVCILHTCRVLALATQTKTIRGKRIANKEKAAVNQTGCFSLRPSATERRDFISASRYIYYSHARWIQMPGLCLLVEWITAVHSLTLNSLRLLFLFEGKLGINPKLLTAKSVLSDICFFFPILIKSNLRFLQLFAVLWGFPMALQIIVSLTDECLVSENGAKIWTKMIAVFSRSSARLLERFVKNS